MKIKSYLKNTIMFLMELGTKSKKQAVMSVIMKKDYMKIAFNFDDDLPLNKPLKFYNMIITSDLFLNKMVNFIHKFF